MKQKKTTHAHFHRITSLQHTLYRRALGALHLLLESGLGLVGQVLCLVLGLVGELLSVGLIGVAIGDDGGGAGRIVREELEEGGAAEGKERERLASG
jgi:hypothetical protein